MDPDILLRTVVQALEKRNVQPLLDALGDDVIWKPAATMKGFFGFGGQYMGREAVEEYVSQFDKNYAIRSMTPKEIVSEGDVVWGLFWADLIYKPSMAQVRFDWVIRWRLKDGKIVEHQAFIDTAAVLLQEQSGLLPN